MTPNDWKQVERLFHLMPSLSEEARQRLFASELHSPEVLTELRALLECSKETNFLSSEALEGLRESIDSALRDRLNGSLSEIESELLGTVVAERYRVVSLLGRGTHNIVFRGVDQRVAERQVVIKVLFGDSDPGGWMKKRFQQEIDILGRLRHPAVVTAYDCGVLPDGQPFLVMDFIPGVTLRERMKTPISRAEIAHIIRQVSEALAAAHSVGIIHRDVKPENIMVEQSAGKTLPAVKLIDFGIARIIQVDATDVGTSVVAGTQRYMAPEQFFGLASTATDVYALGAVCFELLECRVPFEMNEIGLELTGRGPVRNRPELKMVNCPSAACEQITRALSFRPENRPQSVARFGTDVAKDLEEGGGAKDIARRPYALAKFALLLSFSLCLTGRSRPEPNRVTMIDAASFSVTGVERLSSDGEYATDPAVSASGKLVAFAADRDGRGHTDIWVYERATRSFHRVTNLVGGADQPSFSADELTIAFHSVTENSILTIPVAGGDAQLIVASGTMPQFSPDGESISFLRGQTESGSAVPMIIPLVGARESAMNKNCGGGTSAPVWSPDGSRLLVWCKEGGGASQRSDFWIVPVESGAAIQTHATEIIASQGLSPVGSMSYFAGKAWIGDRIIFLAKKRLQTRLWSLRIDKTSNRAIGPAEEFGSDDLADARLMSQSRLQSGLRLIAFAKERPSSQIWRLHLSRTGSPTEDPVLLSSEDHIDTHPSISTDGNKLAFISDRSGEREVWFKDLMKSSPEEIPLTKGIAVSLAPRLSPEGSKVIFSTELNHHRSVWLIGTDGADTPKLVCKDCGYPRPWWPDGRHMVFDYGYDSIPAIDKCCMTVIRNLFDPSEAPFSFGAGYYIEPRVTVDVSWVVSSRVTATGEAVFATRLEKNNNGTITASSEQIRLSGIDQHRALSGTWDDKGETVFFLGDRDGHVCIWGRHVEPRTKNPIGREFPVFHFHSAERSLENLGMDSGIDLAYANHALVFAQGSKKSSIWIAEAKGNEKP